MKNQAMIPGSLASVAPRSVRLGPGLLRDRVETNRTVTIPAVIRRCEETGRVENLRNAAHPGSGLYRGTTPFEDTDVYKAIEGASGSLAVHPDPALEAKVDELVAVVAAAQEPDGYLYSARTNAPNPPVQWVGPGRWSSLLLSHELYNCGHLVEAACAHYEATGKRTLLDVATRFADLVCREFAPGARHDACGHPLVERALARLSRLTGERRYLDTARFFLEQRGHHEGRLRYGHPGNEGYAQDHLPVAEQREVTGHAVRAMYLYAGMTDVAALGPELRYSEAVAALWDDLLTSKVYLTGGVGARHDGESFGAAFELPNDTAYSETCAAIGLVVWARRMFLGSGDARFLDVQEQVLHNAVFAGSSLSGNEFFYVNPLASDGVYGFSEGSPARQPWYTVSCCPTGYCRFVPTLPGYLYAVRDRDILVCHYAASTAEVDVDGERLLLTQESSYPWEGTIRVRVGGAAPVRARLCLRIPGWVRGEVLGGRLYSAVAGPNGSAAGGGPNAGNAGAAPILRVNGAPDVLVMERGFAVLDRTWAAGDTVELTLPMPVLRIHCDPRVAANRGRVALQRGPIVYCVEERDSALPLESLVLGPRDTIDPAWQPDHLGGVVTLRGPGFTAIPYATWANRGPGPMEVWLKEG